MQARDVMSTTVATIKPDTTVGVIVALLLERRISGLPVLDDNGRVVGVVSEGDLLHRKETDTERHRGRWLSLWSGTEELARDYVKSHGLFARDIMSRPAITIAEGAALGDVVNILESRRIKRVPVVRDGKLVGIVTRADLLRGLATQNLARGMAAPSAAQPASQAADRAVRDQLLRTMKRADWTSATHVNVIVTDGVVHLWGLVNSGEERRALHVAAENVDGVTGVEDHLGSFTGVTGFA